MDASDSLAAGEYEARVVADVFDEVAESDETNNEANATFSVSAAVVRVVDVSPDHQSKTVRPKESVVYEIVVTNTGSAHDTVHLTVSPNEKGWRAELNQSTIALDPGKGATVHVTVKAPPKGTTFTAMVTAVSDADASATDSGTLETRMVAG